MCIRDRDKGIQNFYLNIMVISRELLIDLVTEASLLGKEYLERDVLLPKLSKLNVQGYKYDGYTACITGLKSYFDAVSYTHLAAFLWYETPLAH